MRAGLRILTVGLALAGALSPVTVVQAAGPGRVLAREQVPAKAETCRPRWPYVVLTCVG